MDRNQLLSLILVLVGLAIVFTLLALGWRARRRRQADLPSTAPLPASVADPSYVADVFYVATTRADSPTDRIVVEGLGFRARAGVLVHDGGLILHLAGADEIWIPRADIRGIGRATWTIDRVVGKDGLVFVRWMLGDTAVDSYLRSPNPDDLVEALDTLTPKEAA